MCFLMEVLCKFRSTTIVVEGIFVFFVMYGEASSSLRGTDQKTLLHDSVFHGHSLHSVAPHPINNSYQCSWISHIKDTCHYTWKWWHTEKDSKVIKQWYHHLLLGHRIVVCVTRNNLYSNEEFFSSSSPTQDRIVPTDTGTKPRSHNTCK